MTTTPTKSVRLEANSSSGGKFYTVTLNPSGTGYTVDFTYGAVGDTPRTGTKTKSPVALEQAEEIMADLIKDKMTGKSHYQIVDGSVPDMVTPTAAGANGSAVPIVAPEWCPPRLLVDVDPNDIPRLVASPDYWVQIKHDGDRVQIHSGNGRVLFLSGRTARPRSCPKAIHQTMSRCPTPLVLDGELVGETLWAFDILWADKVDLREDEYQRRDEILAAVIKQLGCPAIRLVESARTPEEKERLILKAKEDHQEGVVFINSRAPYRPGDGNKDNLRYKFRACSSFIVAAYNHGKGKNSFDVKLYDGTIIGTCSLNGKERPPLESVIDASYLYCQSKLVQADFKCIRTDVEPAACTRDRIQFKDGIDPARKTR